MPNFQELGQTLVTSIEASIVGEQILDALLPNGSPLDVEGQYWDYKEPLPSLPKNATAEQKLAHKAELAEIIKDAVSFYNAYGGYLVFGVSDKGDDRVVGCDEILDCGDFNQRIEGAIGFSFECIYCSIPLKSRAGKTIGILFIPRRPDNKDPASFRKSAQAHSTGKKAYNANDTYVRIRDQSRPASDSSADWKFLHLERKTNGRSAVKKKSRGAQIRVNLPPRDPDLTRFIGRESDLGKLRRWLADKRSPTRLVTGIGGLGKTSIAYRFCEEIVDTNVGDIEQLIWLTAKSRTFSAISGNMVEASRVDFIDSSTLYSKILQSLGYDPNWRDEDPSDSDLIEKIVETLSIYACMIVVDDIDSLSPDDQREVVHTLSNAVARTVDGFRTPSRILFTSRIDQGVAPGSVIKVEGFVKDEFDNFVREVANTLDIKVEKKLFDDEIYIATSGSPLFAASILRLVRLGTTLESAI